MYGLIINYYEICYKISSPPPPEKKSDTALRRAAMYTIIYILISIRLYYNIIVTIIILSTKQLKNVNFSIKYFPTETTQTKHPF